MDMALEQLRNIHDMEFDAFDAQRILNEEDDLEYFVEDDPSVLEGFLRVVASSDFEGNDEFMPAWEAEEIVLGTTEEIEGWYKSAAQSQETIAGLLRAVVEVG